MNKSQTISSASSSGNINSLEFEIEPPILVPWLSDDEKERNILLIDLQIDKNSKSEFRFDLDVAFNPIGIRRGSVNRRDFYVGCSGAEITISVQLAKVLKFTEACSLHVNYSNQVTHQRSTSLSLVPEIKTKNGTSEAEMKLGAIQHDRSKEVTFTATFSSDERLLAPVKLGDTIKWTITLPKGQKVIRDFLIGNINLFAVFDSIGKKIIGKITARPSDVTFFDADRQAIGFTKSVLMHYVLYKQGINIYNVDGFKINLKELGNEE